MRIILALALAFFLGSYAPTTLFTGPERPLHAALEWREVPLWPDDPARRDLGKLRFLNGWVIESADPRFGGISALAVRGTNVTAVSDAGWLLRFGLPGRRTSSIAEVRPILEGPRGGFAKKDRDAESLLLWNSSAWIGFEFAHEIWRYGLSDWKAEAHAAPRAMQDWPNNSGAEGLVRLRDGRFLVFSEGEGRGEGMTEVLLFAGDPTVTRAQPIPLRYRKPVGYRLTDAALLPDGSLLLLNRRFRWTEGVAAKLVHAKLPPLRKEAVIEGEVIATLKSPVTVDNMEGLSLTREGERTILWMASDDNYNPLQRTLLLKFELLD
jgi:hypothetical protein